MASREALKGGHILPIWGGTTSEKCLILASKSQQLAVECRASAFLGWWYRQWQQLEGRGPSSLLATGAPSGNYALARNLSMTQHLLPARSCVGHRVRNLLLRELTS